MSTTKIKGYARKEGATHVLFHTGTSADAPAILFVGSDGKPPVVLTEEEHEQKFQERAKAILLAILATKYDYRESEDIVDAHQIEAIAAKHGITLP